MTTTKKKRLNTKSIQAKRFLPGHKLEALHETAGSMLAVSQQRPHVLSAEEKTYVTSVCSATDENNAHFSKHPITVLEGNAMRQRLVNIIEGTWERARPGSDLRSALEMQGFPGDWTLDDLIWNGRG